MRLGLTIVACLLLSIPPVPAQDQSCPHQPAIVSLANAIIEKRDALSGFPQRNFGTDAAYLKIRYEPLADDQAEALLARLIAGRARMISDLAFAWSYGKDGGDATRRLLGDDAIAEALSSGSLSAVRAMLDAGDEDALFEAIADLPENAVHSAYRAVLVAAADYSDADRSDLAKLALQKEIPLLAAGLIALQSKPKAWTAFVDSVADPDLVDAATQLWRWVPAVAGNPELPPSGSMTPYGDPELRKKLHLAIIAAAREPQFSFLPTLLNQTGRVDEVAAAAQRVRDAIESGAVAGDGTFGPAWLVAYDALRQSWGERQGLEAALGGFKMHAGAAVGETPLEILDMLIAVDALTPYVRGETSEHPAMPAALSIEFRAWPDWLAAADLVRAKPTDRALADETTLPYAAELLLASGDSGSLAALIADSPATSPLLRLATDVAVRLDRLCEGYLAHRAEALLLAGQFIYKFE